MFNGGWSAQTAAKELNFLSDMKKYNYISTLFSLQLLSIWNDVSHEFKWARIFAELSTLSNWILFDVPMLQALGWSLNCNFCSIMENNSTFIGLTWQRIGTEGGGKVFHQEWQIMGWRISCVHDGDFCFHSHRQFSHPHYQVVWRQTTDDKRPKQAWKPFAK